MLDGIYSSAKIEHVLVCDSRDDLVLQPIHADGVVDARKETFEKGHVETADSGGDGGNSDRVREKYRQQERRDEIRTALVFKVFA
jgi:hypothetical protein